MIGKRVIILKRPAVLCAAAFVLGIVLAEYSAGVAAIVAVGLWGACMFFLRSLRKGRRSVSVADKLLLLAPVFLLLGCGVMRTEQHRYEQKSNTFAECMETGREVLAEGTVSHIRRTTNGVRLELKNAVVAPYEGDTTEYRPVGKLLVYADDIFAENGEIKYGQKIFVYGSGSEFEEASNPGGFDAKAYYFSMGITGAVHGKTVRIRSFSYHRLSQALFQAKNKLLNRYVTYLGKEGAGVISSMLLGERALLSEETQALYRHGGISHILAISGLHVSLIGTALYELLRKTVLGRNGAIPVACAGVLLYGTFVEAGISTKRAVIMFLLLLLATILGRTYDTLSAMSVSVIMLLCGSPGALYTASFQLSFAAAYGASVLAVLLREKEEPEKVRLKRENGPIGENSERKGQGQAVKENVEEALEAAGRVAKRSNSRWVRVWEYFAERLKSMFVFGLAIQAATFPFTVYHFFEYPTYGFVINPLVVPLMTILLLCGLLSGVCGLFVPWLGYFFAGGAGGILWIYEVLCRWVEKLPGSLLLIGQPEWWQIAVYYALLAVCLYIWLGRGRKWVSQEFRRNEAGFGWIRSRVGKAIDGIVYALGKQKGVLFLLLCLPLCLLPVSSARFEAAFLDVDQGDGIVLRKQGDVTLLVDGGSTGVQKVGEKRMIPYLKSQGIRVIDCAFVSHTDSDHMSGIKELLEAMPEYSEYRESVWGYTGTPVINRLVLPEWYVFEGENAVGSVLSDRDEIDETYRSLTELARKKQVEVCYMAAGDRMTVGKELVLSCLAPEKGILYGNKNAASMVLLVSYGEVDMLLTGDMERDGELRLLESGVPTQGGVVTDRVDYGIEDICGEKVGGVSVEVLKVSHHGSYTASSAEFISALHPVISVISCGRNNRYGHPHVETLETLAGTDSRVYRTDESGCVTVKVKRNGRVKVKVLREPD